MDRIDKHEAVCKVNQKPKRVKRFHKVYEKEEDEEAQSDTKKKWKQQHENLQNILNRMKQIKQAEEQGLDPRSIPALPPTEDDSLIQCRGCGRRFNENALTRHEPGCMEKAARNQPPPPPKKQSQQAFDKPSFQTGKHLPLSKEQLTAQRTPKKSPHKQVLSNSAIETAPVNPKKLNSPMRSPITSAQTQKAVARPQVNFQTEDFYEQNYLIKNTSKMQSRPTKQPS